MRHVFIFWFQKLLWKIQHRNIYCTVGNHRSKGLVERLGYTIKSKLLAMSFELPKPPLNASIEKIIWNLRISKQSAIGCFPFEKHFNRTANTRLKNHLSDIDHLDKGKDIMSKQRASNWELHDGQKMGIWMRKSTALRTQKTICH